MTTIWKFPVPELGKPIVHALNGDVIHFGAQVDGFKLWAGHTPGAGVVERSFIVVGTGWDIEADWAHVQSVIDGQFVWHLYEIKP